MRMPIELLVLACLVVGVAPSISIGPSLATAARPVVGGVLPAYSLAVWHGFNAPFVMSLVAISVGVVGYRWLGARQRQGLHQNPPVLDLLNGRRLFESIFVTLTRRSARRSAS